MTLIFAEDGFADIGAGRALAGPAGWKARIGCSEADLSGWLQAGSQPAIIISRSGIFNTDFITLKHLIMRDTTDTYAIRTDCQDMANGITVLKNG